MNYHDHTTFVAGCFRCELGRDEAMHAIVEERDELEAEVARLLKAGNALDAPRPTPLAQHRSSAERFEAQRHATRAVVRADEAGARAAKLEGECSRLRAEVEQLREEIGVLREERTPRGQR